MKCQVRVMVLVGSERVLGTTKVSHRRRTEAIASEAARIWCAQKWQAATTAPRPGVKQARESLSALLHDYVVVPLEQRPRDRSSQIHPALGGAYLAHRC